MPRILLSALLLLIVGNVPCTRCRLTSGRKGMFLKRALQLLVIAMIPIGLTSATAQESPFQLAACNILNGKMYGDCAGVNVNIIDQPKNVEIRSLKYESGIVGHAVVLQGGHLYITGTASSRTEERYLLTA